MKVELSKKGKIKLQRVIKMLTFVESTKSLCNY